MAARLVPAQSPPARGLNPMVTYYRIGVRQYKNRYAGVYATVTESFPNLPDRG